MQTTQSPEQTAALQKVWAAAQDGYGVHLSPEETRLVWDRILADTREKLAGEIKTTLTRP